MPMVWVMGDRACEAATSGFGLFWDFVKRAAQYHSKRQRVMDLGNWSQARIVSIWDLPPNVNKEYSETASLNPARFSQSFEPLSENRGTLNLPGNDEPYNLT